MAIKHTGIVTSGISVARSDPKNTKITKPTSTVVIADRPVDLLDRGANVQRLVAARDELHAFRQLVVDFLDLCFHGIEHLDGVRRRLLDDAEPRRQRAVGAEDAIRLARRDLDVRDFAQADQVAVGALCDDEIAEVVGGLKVARDAHLEVEVLRLEAARRQLDVLALQRRPRCR